MGWSVRISTTSTRSEMMMRWGGFRISRMSTIEDCCKMSLFTAAAILNGMALVWIAWTGLPCSVGLS